MPDTTNHKYEGGKATKVQKLNADLRYSIKELQDKFPPYEGPRHDINSVVGPDKLPLIENPAEVMENRNHHLTKVVGKWIRDGLNRERTWMLAQAWYMQLPCNADKDPKDDFDMGEVEQTHDSVWKTHERKQAVVTEIVEGEADEVQSIEFPRHIMKGFAGDFSQSYGQIMEAPEHFFFMSALTLLGAHAGDKVLLDSEVEAPPRLFTVLLGESGRTRKSTALKTARNFFYSQGWRTAEAGSPNSDMGVYGYLEDHKDCLLFYDELRSFVEKANIKNSTLLSSLTTLFESNFMRARTKGENIVLEDVHVSMLSASTIETFQTMFSSKFLDIGFINRLFLVPGRSERSIPIPRRLPKEQYAYLGKRLDECERFINTYSSVQGTAKKVYPYYIPMTDGAWDLWATFYDELHEGTEAGDTRLDSYGLRFFPLLAINQCKKEVDSEIVQDTIDLMRWQKIVRDIYWPQAYVNDYARLEGLIRQAMKEKPKWKHTDLFNKCNFRKYGSKIPTICLDNMINNGEIIVSEEVEGGGAGRPGKVYKRHKLWC